MRYLLTISSFFLLIFSAFSQDVDFEYKGSTCINSKITFIDKTGNFVDDWTWEFGDGQTTNGNATIEHTYTSAGVYTVTLRVKIAGNSFMTQKDITIHEHPICDFVIDTVYFSSFTRVFTDSSTSKTNEFVKYIWDFGNGAVAELESNKAEYKFSSEGEFSVWHKVIDKYGCHDSITKKVSITDIYRVPNVFTPNGDGINDLFVVTVNGVEKFSIQIFSRWGNLVFKRDNVQQIVWDGTMPDGSTVQSGTYFYEIQASDSQKEYKPERGHITIFRDKQ